MDLKPVLTIAGSDSSGGAGIQADLKTMLANGVYGMSVITTLTAQNTQRVSDFLDSTPEFLAAQLDAVFEDIPPAAVKTGMIATGALVEVVAEKLAQYKAKNVVVDPVMISGNGEKLIYDSAIEAIPEKLFPLATVVTPNIHELEVLTGEKITDSHGLAEAAKILAAKYNCAVLAKGGSEATDVLCEGGNIRWYRGRKVDTKNTHGTGCTLSSAIAANLAKGQNLGDAISNAKKYVTGAMSSGLNLGHGNGPLDHGFNLRG